MIRIKIEFTGRKKQVNGLLSEIGRLRKQVRDLKAQLDRRDGVWVHKSGSSTWQWSPGTPVEKQQ